MTRWLWVILAILLVLAPRDEKGPLPPYIIPNVSPVYLLTNEATEKWAVGSRVWAQKAPVAYLLTEEFIWPGTAGFYVYGIPAFGHGLGWTVVHAGPGDKQTLRHELMHRYWFTAMPQEDIEEWRANWRSYTGEATRLYLQQDPLYFGQPELWARESWAYMTEGQIAPLVIRRRFLPRWYDEQAVLDQEALWQFLSRPFPSSQGQYSTPSPAQSQSCLTPPDPTLGRPTC